MGVMKVLCLIFFIAGSVLADHPPPYAPAPYHPEPAYHPAPVPHHPAPYHPEKGYKEPPKPFAYEYGTVDDYGRHSAKTETQDEYGVVHGEYRVELPDGRTQIVSYTADHENGFVADVKYEGVAHPPEPYHKPAPAYHKPAPYHPEPAYHQEPAYHPAPYHAA